MELFGEARGCVVEIKVRVIDDGHGVRDVVLTVDPGATLADIAPLLWTGQPVTAVWCDDRCWPVGETLTACALVHGTMMRPGYEDGPQGSEPGHNRAPDRCRHGGVGVVTVGVTGGYGAGATADLPLGMAWVGSAPDCAVQVPGLPARACRLVVALGGAITVHPEAGVGVVQVGRRVLDPVTDPAASIHCVADNASPAQKMAVVDGFTWHSGVRIGIGGSIFEVLPPDVALTPTQAEGVPVAEVLRPPRLLPPEPGGVFVLPQEPKKPVARSFPLLLMLAPLLMAGVMIGITGTWHYALFAVLSPLMMVGSWLSGNAGARKTYRRELAEWRTNTARITGDAMEAVRGQEETRRFCAPDLATVARAALAPTGRLWERSSDDPDFLQLRVGNADLPSTVTVEDPSMDAHHRKKVPVALDVPAVVSLPQRGVVGVCGHPDYARAVVVWWVVQCAVLHSPRLVWLYVLAQSRRASEWEWVKWLPHCEAMAGQGGQVTVGCGADAVARRLGELAQLIASRMAFVQQNPGRDHPGPAVVVVWDGSRVLRQHPAAVVVLSDGPSVGVFSVCLDDQAHHVPGQADAVVEVSDRACVVVRQQRAQDVVGVVADVVVPSWAETVALRLAGLSDGGAVDQAMIVDSCRLVDVLGGAQLSVQQILAQWSVGGSGTKVRLGEGLDGPFWVDIVADGPHALVAGTTGAGKSELLRTWLCSLAVSARPDELIFVLVDYKGGAAFAQCAQLPHTVGLVTDLDAHLVRRCLASLAAEITVRERLLAQAGASDIAQYLVRRRRDESLPPLPRLMLVIDEFAALVHELPEFMDGIIDIAQRGRSLGMHVVLATQRPAGVVSGPIRANTNLRFCLRVTDAGESQDVVDAPDAAAIPASLPGRCVARCGPAAVQQFQTARVSVGTGAHQVAPASVVSSFGVTDGANTDGDGGAERGGDDDQTDLAVLVDVVQQAAGALGVDSPRRPWLPQLPPVWSAGFGQWAVRDEPALQSQAVLTGDVSQWGHWFVIGAARSGRSHALRMMVAAAVQHYSVADLHVYGVDCGSGGLGVLAQLPHCGAVVSRREIDRLRRLLDVLTAQVRRRGEMLAQAGVGSWAELRAVEAERGEEHDAERGGGLAYILVVVDRWEGWSAGVAEVDNGALAAQFAALLSDGPPVGVLCVVSGDRSLAVPKMAAVTQDRLVLRLNDDADYALLGVALQDVPERMSPGRAVHAGSGLEHQIGSLGDDPCGAAQHAEFVKLAARVRHRDEGVAVELGPQRLKVLPRSVTVEQIAQWPQGVVDGPMRARCGVGTDAVVAVGPDVGRHGVCAVAGPARSGRSTLLALCAQGMAGAGGRVVVWAPRVSVVRELDGGPGVARVFVDAGVSAEVLAEAVGDDPGTVLVVDDADLLRTVPAAAWFADFLRGARDRGQGALVAGLGTELSTGLSGWPAELRRSRYGLLTAVTSLVDGDVVGVRVTRSMVVGSATLGRAYFHDGSGVLTPIVYPDGFARS